MTPTGITISSLGTEDLDSHLAELCAILIDSVAGGAAISFMAPLNIAEAKAFWEKDVKSGVETGHKKLFGAFVGEDLIGTVQVVLAMPPNQRHRAEISKMIVHPRGRRRGVGTALMHAALDAAKKADKTLITLDTRTGDVSEALYRSVGFKEAGVIPDFAYDPDGSRRHATTYMYRYL